MVSFSKPQGSSSTAETIPAKRKRILNSKISDENNVDKEAVKRRKQEATQQAKRKNPIADGSDSEDIPMPSNRGKTGPRTTNSEAESKSAHDIDSDDEPKEIPVFDFDNTPSDEDETDDDVVEVVEVPVETPEQELGESKLIRTLFLY
jgi:hypothetical protein